MKGFSSVCFSLSLSLFCTHDSPHSSARDSPDHIPVSCCGQPTNPTRSLANQMDVSRPPGFDAASLIYTAIAHTFRDRGCLLRGVISISVVRCAAR